MDLEQQSGGAHTSAFPFLEVTVGYLSVHFFFFVSLFFIYTFTTLTYFFKYCTHLFHFLHLVILVPVAFLGLIDLFIASALSCSWRLVSSRAL